RFTDITNGPIRNSSSITTTADYWQYVTTKFTTAASTSNIRLDVLHTLESGDAVFVDDVELYPVANHAQTISLPAKNDTTDPTGSISTQGGQTTVSSNSVTLSLTGSDNFDTDNYLQMQISEDENFSSVDW